MSNASRADSRKAIASTMSRAALMRTAATALIAASPFVYSGASAATATSSAQLTAQVLQSGKVATQPSLFSFIPESGSGHLQVTAPSFQAAATAGGSPLHFLAPTSFNTFQLTSPALKGFTAPKSASFANQPVQNLLAVPMDAQAGAGTMSVSTMSITPMAATQTYNNSSDITVGAGQTAIDIDADPDSIVVNNSGDLTGGGGINVVTGKFDPNTASVTSTYEGGWTSRYSAQLYDNYGNPVTEPCSWNPSYTCNVSATTAYVQNKFYLNEFDVDNSDASITIGNSGNIDFSGLYGIRAENQTGASIDINNSGDISATSDTPRRVGIFANTTVNLPPYPVVDGPNEISPGAYTYNSYGQLTGVTTIGQHEKTYTTDVATNDLGAIRIENSGDIDMGVVDTSDYAPSTRPYYAVSEGIYARGWGGTEIVNSSTGSIKVGDFSSGITSISGGNATITNDGTIEIGNQSTGIKFLAGAQGGETYSAGGNGLIVNTGDITGGMTQDEALASPNTDQFGTFKPASVIGIHVDQLGVNRDYYGFVAEYVETLQEYGFDIDLADYFPNLKTWTTTVRNEGTIDLKDGATGIYGMGVYGDIRAYNSGLIQVGDGHSQFDANFDLRATAIYMNNFPVSGWGDFYAKNELGGIIISGDDAAGISLQNAGGSSTAINQGSITVGNGGVGPWTNYVTGNDYDWLFPSLGISVVNAGRMIGQTATAINTGDITVGELGIGIQVIGNAPQFGAFNPYRITGEIYNTGSVTAGDNSTGLRAGGLNVLVTNEGSVSVGSLDLSGFNPSPNPQHAGTFNFAQMGFGIKAESDLIGTVVNNGSVTTGDNTVGILNGMRSPIGGLATFTIQGEDGVVSTGDNSVGIKADAHFYALLDNAGTISVGNNSVGVDMTPGAIYHDYYGQAVVQPGMATAFNSGLIETGDNSVGVRVNGARYGVQHNWEEYQWPYGWVDQSVTADVIGGGLLFNSGTIRTGANSTAVEVTGYGYYLPVPPQYGSGYVINLKNIGTIDAGQGTAIKVNADNNINAYIRNAGTIVGDILTGGGNDYMLHGAETTASGTTVGNIIMDGHTIDFGGGTNTFAINRGVISVAGGHDNLITGNNLSVEMNYAEIDARNDFIVGVPSLASASTMAITPMSDPSWFSTLTINGDVSGNMRFATDVGTDGESDVLNITGNVADGSEIGFILNPVEQLKGEIEIRPMNIGGTNGADFLDVAGVTGLYADSLIGWETSFEASSGDVVINATFGMGHMATAASAAATNAQNWLTSSLGNFGRHNPNAYTGRKAKGVAIWATAFQDEGEIRPGNDLQNVSFRQVNSGIQGGIQLTQEVGGGRVSVMPTFSYGIAEANLIANGASSRGKPWAVGFNANYVTDSGLYVDATYQRMRMDVDLKTPQTFTGATGEAKINGQGANLEIGYAHKLKSGLTLEPQLQLTRTKLDLDDFASSDGIYNLTDVDGKATTLRAGLTAYKVFETSSGSITPLVSLSYLNALDAEIGLASNGVEFDNDLTGSGFRAEAGILGRHNGWDIAGKVALTKTATTGSILSPSLTVRYGFAKDVAKAATTAVSQLPEVTQATVANGEAGGMASVMATAAPAEEGTQLLHAAYEQDKAEPTGEQLPVQTTPEQVQPVTEQAPAEEEGDIVVTGTIVRRGMPKDMAPVTVITSEDMAMRGLTTLGEVLGSFTQNSGLAQGKASNLLGRFTHGAEEVNMRGLGAGRTLVLVNGRRIADYPLPFGGEQNAVDLGAIPMAAVANVQYLSSGASATYGSDAVGGVVNIITKRDMEQTVASLDGGIVQQGFGEWLRGSVITGNSYSKGSFTIGAEALYSGEALASDSKYLRKNAPFNAGMVSILENTMAGMNPVVPSTACAPLGFEFDAANDECTKDVSDTISLSPTFKKVSAFFDGRYDLTDNIELFGSAMAAKSWIEARSNVLFWQGVVAPDDNSAAMFITRGFSEEELGISTVKVNQTMWSAVVGAKGGFDVGGKRWYWDVAYSHANYKTDQTTINLKEEGIKNWILNGAASVTDSPDQRYTYFVDPAFYNSQLVDNIVRPVQPSDVDGLIGKNVMKGSSSAGTLAATVNGEFGDLGFLYKPVKFAARAEYAHQTTKIDPDERTQNTTGEGWFNIGSIQADGKRSRWALAAEIDASVLSNLDIMLAGRYDHYSDASSVKGRLTGQAKFLWRPNDWLKVRGGYGQTFRAPDMFNIYGETDAFEFVPDYMQPGCFDGTNYFCGYNQVASTRRADPGLSEEHGDDIGLGIIFNPIPNFTVSIDWYRIKLKDLVITESSADLVLKEWQCANGVLDGSSMLCADVNNRVIRNDFGAIERVIVQPINQDSLTQQGIDMAAQYSFESAKLGQFAVSVSYSKMLKFELNRFSGDEPLDLVYGEPGGSTPANGLGASFTWYQPLTTGKAISAGLFVQRQGRIKNYDHSQFLEPFYDVNLVVGYQLSAKTQGRFSVSNLLNTDPTSNGSNIYPGYWAHLQNAFGRSFSFSLSHAFN